MSLYSLAREWLFCLDAERVHEAALRALPLLARCRSAVPCDARLAVRKAGLVFSNPVGLAAGFDKSARVFPCLHAFGFGFAEVGTLTPRPQSGNPRPRLFRVPESAALLNRMGFNNDGAEAAAARLATRPRGIPIGANIGKNKDTPNPRAVEDYAAAFRLVAPHCDYVAVNVSSPNTPGLRELQDKESLIEIAAALQDLNGEWRRPILLKIAPDLSEAALDSVVEVVENQKLAGLIATNTTTEKSDLPGRWREEAGGVSGAPLRAASDRALAFLARRLSPRRLLIGVGGIMTPEDAIRKIELGADLVQLYTGWVYHGPDFAREILAALVKRLDSKGGTLAGLQGSKPG